MGEGISYALEYGIMAADAIVAERCRGATRASRYRAPSRAGAMARKLGAARVGVAPLLRPACGVVVPAGAAQPARAGASDSRGTTASTRWDERSAWAALGALVRPGAWQRA